jgi:hypothetical protein
MFADPLIIPSTPFSIRVAPVAIAAFRGLSERENVWLYDHLNRTGEEALVWAVSESDEAPHDLWVLHRWSPQSRMMDILDLGYFPRRGVAAPARRAAEPDEERWENEGGANPQR